MARERYLVGVDQDQHEPTPEIGDPKTPKGKWENFWYYYKIHFWVAVLVIVVILASFALRLGKNKPDYRVVIASSSYFTDAAVAEIEDQLVKYGKDLNGDNQVVVEISNLHFDFNPTGTTNNDFEANQAHLFASFSDSDSLIYIVDPKMFDFITLEPETDERDDFYAPFPSGIAINSPENYDKNLHFWNWRGHPLSTSDQIMLPPENLYFGVRAVVDPDEKELEFQRECFEFLARFINDEKVLGG